MITILTATYNRGDLLINLYNSLKSQTSKNFEWIIIDDGSTDNTEKIINQIKNDENVFDIRYFKTINGGKHRAINLGVDYARYKYTFIVDSDDYLLDMAIEKVEKWINTIDDDTFAGVSGLKGNKDKHLVGQYPNKRKYKDYIDASNLERKKLNLLGDKAEIYRTDILRKYKFPEFDNETFLTEAAVWDMIAFNGYKIRWFNEIIYICEYHEDGLTKMGVDKEINNFKGFTYYVKLRIKTSKGILKIAPICSFANICRVKGIRIPEMSDILDINIMLVGLANIIDIIFRKISNINKNLKS